MRSSSFFTQAERLKQKGMTLLELLIVLAISALLVFLAAPNFQDSFQSNRGLTSARSFADYLKLARSTAVGRGTTVTVCPVQSTGPVVCDRVTPYDWSNGWAVFVDRDKDGLVDSPDNLQKVFDSISPNVMRVVDDAGNEQINITFDARGRSNIELDIEICGEDTSDDTLGRSVILEASGMVALGRLNTATNIYQDKDGADIDCGS